MRSAAASVARSAALIGGRSERGELGQVFAAVRSRLGLVTAILGFAGLAWWSTTQRMAGMDAGPGTDLGALGWFLGVWIVMMAAMMLPSLVPVLALHAQLTRRRGWSRPLQFAGAYLVVWGAAGLLAYGVFRLGRHWLGSALAWDTGGRWLAGSVLVLAALYELTPLKSVCLGRCRRPFGFSLSSWGSGRLGAVELGVRHAGWCLGCCWALMASLFALGVMSLTWMAVVSMLIGAEKALPWRRLATRGTAVLLVLLALAVLAAPHELPGLVVPGGAHRGIHAIGMMR